MRTKPAVFLIAALAAALMSALAGSIRAAGAEQANPFARADALFARGEADPAMAVLTRALADRRALPARNADAMLRRLDEAAARHAVALARRGDRSGALNAASLGMTLSRRAMERPDADCGDVRTGIVLWRIATAGLEEAWQALGEESAARKVATDRDAMERLARDVILPRCDACPHPRTARAAASARAEARALVRLWEFHLVRTAADNIG